MITVGLTGGIGSGKSTVSEVWKKKGAYVIQADSLAKQIMQEDETIKQQIMQAFGRAAYNQDGQLNRDYLSREAFEKGRVQELNRIVHPKVHIYVKKRMEAAKEEGFEVFLYEAALLLQQGRPDYLDRIILVTAPRNKRIEWVSKRDEVSLPQIQARMKRQQSESDMKPHADYVIRNNGTIHQLEQKAQKLFKTIKEKH